MSVLWDDFGLHNLYSGVSRHAIRLSQSLLQLGESPVFRNSCPPQKLNNLFSLSELPYNASSKKNFFKLLRVVMENPVRGDFSVWHGLSNLNGAFESRFRSSICARVLTVHDIIPLLLDKHQTSRLKRSQYKYLLTRAISNVDQVICVSKWTQSLLSDVYPKFQSKFIFIPNGVDPILPYVPRETYPEVLFVSRFESYKGFKLLEKIIRIVSDKLKFHIVTDVNGLHYLKQVSPRSQVFTYTAINESELDGLRRRCSIYLQTSRYEGFCLPAAEFLRMGKSVVYCKGSGIDEVMGDCGYALNADSPANHWAETLTHAYHEPVDNPQGCYLDIKNHCETLKTWPEVASKVLGVYNQLR